MKTLSDLDLKNKSVVIRCDYNVPIESGIIKDNYRIVKSLKTLNYLLENNCKIVILSHLGRIKSEEDKKKNSLRIVAEELSKLLNKDVTFINQCYGFNVKEIVDSKSNGDVILLENTRFMDYPDKLESGNNLELAKFWASLGDVFILDAFGSCHRAHASTAGITKFIPSCVGFLVEEELNNLKDLIDIKKRPFTIIMGGAKIEDKLPIIKKLLPKCDCLLLGGGIANSFLKASGIDVGTSLATNNIDLLNELRLLLNTYKDKIIMPEDYVYDGSSIMDLGEKTIFKYAKYIYNSELIFMNGSPGEFEDERFNKGTKAILEILKNSNKEVILGGGDTINATQKFGYKNAFYFQSSGGGATLEYIANGKLEALEYIN